MILILLLTNLTSNVFAQNAVKLNKGDTAPFTGALVKKERLEKLVKAEKSNLTLKDLSIHKDELIEFHKMDAKLQRQKLSEAKFDSNLKSIGMFVLGVVITGFAYKTVEKIK